MGLAACAPAGEPGGAGGERVGPLTGSGAIEHSCDRTGLAAPVGQVLGHLHAGGAYPDGYDFTCTGTLVTREWVLTARHCLDNHVEDGPVTIRSPLEWVKFELPQGPDCGSPGKESGDWVVFDAVPASWVYVGTGMNRDAKPSPHDVGLFRLQTPVPEELVETIPPLFLGSPLGALAEGKMQYAALGGPGSLLVEGVGHPDAEWVMPVESAARLRGLAEPVAHSVVLPRAFPDSGRPAVLVLEPTGPRLIRLGEDDSLSAARAATPSAPEGSGEGPVARSGHLPLFSAAESSLLLVGGTRPGDGEPTRTTWRYDLSTDRWEQLLTLSAFMPSETVLAGTYDSEAQLLYVIDVDAEPGRALRWARLQRVSLRTGEARVLALWPYLQLFQTHSLSLASDGTLVLVGGHPLGWRAWRLEGRGAHLRYLGTTAGTGRVVDRAFPGEEAPMIAVSGWSGVRYLTLDARAFRSGATCSGL